MAAEAPRPVYANFFSWGTGPPLGTPTVGGGGGPPQTPPGDAIHHHDTKKITTHLLPPAWIVLAGITMKRQEEETRGALEVARAKILFTPPHPGRVHTVNQPGHSLCGLTCGPTLYWTTRWFGLFWREFG